MVQGKRDYTKTMADVYTPSLPLGAGFQFIRNTDWKGQPIVQKGASPLQAASEAGDWAAQTLVVPYETMATATHEPGWTPASVAGKFATSTVGISNPTDRARQYMHKQPKYNQQDMKKRAKNAGPLERLTNSLTQ